MRNRGIFWFASLFFLISIFIPSIVDFIVNWWWFEETGYTKLLLTKINFQFIAGIGIAIIAFLFLIINLLLAASSKTPWIITIPANLVGQPLALTNKLVKKVGVIFSIAAAALLGFIASFSWTTIAKFFYITPFNIADPIFNKDISFYIFTLPFYAFGLGLLKFLIAVAL